MFVPLCSLQIFQVLMMAFKLFFRDPRICLSRLIDILIVINYFKFVSSNLETDFIPYTEADGNNRFRFGDDSAIDAGFTESSFKFLNVTYWNTYISGNGLISFTQAHSNSLPPENCVTSQIPMVIPYWADANEGVDPSGSTVTYRETTNAAYLAKIARVIRQAFPSYRRLRLSWIFVVTWRNIAAHNSHPSSSRNTFQLILTTDGQKSFVLIYYDKISWSSGRTFAGFDFGESGRLYKLPGSCSTSITSIDTSSNFNVPGKWAFQVDTDILVPGSATSKTCENDGKSTIRLDPPVVPIIGNIPLLIHGLCLENNASVACVFNDKGQLRTSKIKAVLLNDVAICQVPFLYSLGQITISLLVNYPGQDTIMHTQTIHVVKEHEYSDLPSIHLSKTGNSQFLSAQWAPSLLSMTHIIKADAESDDSESQPNCPMIVQTVQIVLLEHDGKKWRKLGPLTPPILNNGIHMSPLNTTLLDALLQKKGKILLRTFALEATHTLKSGESVQKLLPANAVLGTNSLIDWSIKAESESQKVTFFSTACQVWVDNEPDWPSYTLPCPYTVEQARLDWRFGLETAPHWQLLNEGASSVYIQLVPSLLGAASHCAYDNDGRLMSLVPSIGRVFRRSPNSVTGYWRHFLEDVLPFMYCCKWGNPSGGSSNLQLYAYKCESSYSRKRPIDSPKEPNYEPPQAFRAVGATHLTSFDGNNYIFNGAGEYWLIRTNEDNNANYNHIINNFKMQVRMEPTVSKSGQLSNATVITSVVMEENTNEHDVKVQVEFSSTGNGIGIFVDDQLLSLKPNQEENEENTGSMASPWNFHNQFVLYHTGVIVVLKSDKEATVTFGSGFSFNFNTVEDHDQSIAVNIIGSTGHNSRNKLVGLLGNFDGVDTNDFQLPNGTILDSSMTMEEVHKEFGEIWRVIQSESVFTYSTGKSYTSFNQPRYQPWFLSQDEMDNLTFSEAEFCQNFEDCFFDYLATGNDALASATTGATNLYQEIQEMSSEIVQRCSYPSMSTTETVKGTSRVVGSTLILKRSSDEKFTCVCHINSKSKLPEWVVSLDNGAISSGTTCFENNAKDANKHERTNNDGADKISTASLSSEMPSSSAGFWIVFIVGSFICTIIISVVIAEYPPCKPVKNFFVAKYYNYRVSTFQEDSVSLS